MSVEKASVDWLSLALQLGSVTSAGAGEVRVDSGGAEVARLALEKIVDPQVFRSAVDHYVSGAVGAMLARAVLWHVHPWAGMERCHEIFVTDSDLTRRRRAIELLRLVADARVLPWLPQYLLDPDSEIQSWGAGIVEQLLSSDLINGDACREVFALMAEHPNDAVQDLLEDLQALAATGAGPGAVQS